MAWTKFDWLLKVIIFLSHLEKKQVQIQNFLLLTYISVFMFASSDFSSYA